VTRNPQNFDTFGPPFASVAEKFVKIGPGVPKILADRQTEKLIAVLRSPTGAE